VEAISHINSFIKKTKAVQADIKRSIEHLIKTSRKLERRHNRLAATQQYILDHEMDPIPSELHYIPLPTIHGAITENKRAIAEAIEKFYDIYKDNILDDQSEVLFNIYMSL
jgi:hypothetical protein